MAPTSVTCDSATMEGVQMQSQMQEGVLSPLAPSKLRATVGRIPTMAQLVALLRAEFQGKDSVCPERLKALMAAYDPDTPDWKAFAKFDRHRYTRNLVDSGDGRYNLMLLCWGEGHGSAVHDHADAHCVMRMLAGKLQEVRFAWPAKTKGEEKEQEDEEMGEGEGEEHGNPLQEIGRCTLDNGDVCYINDSMGLHRVENPSHSERAVSLHLYCPPFDACGVFNQRTGKRTKCQVTFWSRPGQPADKHTRRLVPAEDN